MGLYLCVFDGEEELSGVEVGSYEDFGTLRDFVTETLEGGRAGSKFPTFIVHSDCDGAWSVSDSRKLLGEIREISDELKGLPPVPFNSDWQKEVAKAIGLTPASAFEAFIDVDGEPVVDGIARLARIAVKRELPILFQ